jgi:NADPH:quinone reductase-like Zn-dependent oxidoreductase
MRAITVTTYGASPSVTELPTPQARPGQVLIAIPAGRRAEGKTVITM